MRFERIQSYTSTVKISSCQFPPQNKTKNQNNIKWDISEDAEELVEQQQQQSIAAADRLWAARLGVRSLRARTSGSCAHAGPTVERPRLQLLPLTDPRWGADSSSSAGTPERLAADRCDTQRLISGWRCQGAVETLSVLTLRPTQPDKALNLFFFCSSLFVSLVSPRHLIHHCLTWTRIEAADEWSRAENERMSFFPKKSRETEREKQNRTRPERTTAASAAAPHQLANTL